MKKKIIKHDFSGWVTKYGVKCSDGRTIQPGAFKHMDGVIVPLVYQHGHKEINNVLGKIQLEHREDGVYGYAAFNDTESGKSGKIQVEHGDLTMFSVFANQVKEISKQVVHGMIREASLVLSGANPEARIDNVIIAHDGIEHSIDDEITIFTGETVDIIEHSETEENDMNAVYETLNTDQLSFLYDVAEGKVDILHAEEKTLGEIYQSMNTEQKELVYAIAAQLAADEGDLKQSDDLDQNGSNEEDLKHSDEGGQEMNLFEKGGKVEEGKALTHDQITAVFADALSMGSLKQSVIKHAGTYGIDNLDVLFPDAKMVGKIEVDQRRKEWVKVFMAGIRKVPWAKIKSIYADITADEARAKGYIKGNEKFEEVFPLFSRVTDSTMVYKKQKLDKQDIIDVKANFNIVQWLKAEMTMMLEEEIARAMLLGDGRLVTDRDKISESHIRPIYTDNDVYTIKIQLENDVTGIDELEQIMLGMEDFEGEGAVCFATWKKITEWKLLKDNNGAYRFKTLSEVASFMGVKQIVECPVQKNVSREVDGTDYDLVCQIIDLGGYTSGTNEGGKMKDYEQFDIDFNQEKYLKETSLSGAMTSIRKAVTVEKAQAAG